MCFYVPIRANSTKFFVLLITGWIASANTGLLQAAPDKHPLRQDARISSVYAHEAELVRAAFGFRLSDGTPIRPGLEAAVPMPGPSADKKVLSPTMPNDDAKNRKYPFPSDYDYRKDAHWKEKSAQTEKLFQLLITEYLAREGPQSRTAAKLRWHLSRLYCYSGDKSTPDPNGEALKVFFLRVPDATKMMPSLCCHLPQLPR